VPGGSGTWTHVALAVIAMIQVVALAVVGAVLEVKRRKANTCSTNSVEDHDQNSTTNTPRV
jgi:ABC-type arginine transport system permease subunit